MDSADSFSEYCAPGRQVVFMCSAGILCPYSNSGAPVSLDCLYIIRVVPVLLHPDITIMAMKISVEVILMRSSEHNKHFTFDPALWLEAIGP